MGTNLTWLKDDRCLNNWLLFFVFLICNFHLSSAVMEFLRAAKKLFDFLFSD